MPTSTFARPFTQYLERHERRALRLRFGRELHDLARVREQPPLANRIVLAVRACRRILGDGHIHQRQLRRIDLREHPALRETRLA
jgi:hypothetical protein